MSIHINTYEQIDSETVRLTVSNSQRSQSVLIDADDVERVKAYRWRIIKNTITTSIDCIDTPIHRFIVDALDGQRVKFLDKDKSNCRSSNLTTKRLPKYRRSDPIKAHCDNATGFIGVRQNGKRYQAAIQRNSRRRVLGQFDSSQAAARAYDAESRRLNPQTKRLNFP